MPFQKHLHQYILQLYIRLFLVFVYHRENAESKMKKKVCSRDEKFVVMQGVVRADQPQQWILVERTFNGTVGDTTAGLLPGAGVAVPAARPARSIRPCSRPIWPASTSSRTGITPRPSMPSKRSWLNIPKPR